MKKLFLKIAVALTLTAAVSTTVLARPVDGDNVQSVETVLAVKPVGGGIQITVDDTESHQFYVYSITGQMVKSVTVSETAVVDLPQGCYIVKCKQWSKKIVVR